MAQAMDLIEAYPHQAEADSFNFRKSWARIRHACSSHKLLIAATCVVTLALTSVYIMLWPPVYTAKVELIGESDKDQSREGFYETWAVFRKEQLPDEVQMFTAEPVLAEVIKRMHLQYGEVYHSFFGHLGYLWSESLPGRTYRHIKEFLFPHHPGPYEPTKEEGELARTLDAFKGGVKLDSVQETNLGNLVVAGPTPRVAEIANTIVAVYMEDRRARHVQEADSAYDALNSELAKARTELSDLEEKQREYYSQNNLLLTFEKDKIDIGQTATLRAEISDLQTSIAAMEQTLAQVNTELAKENKSVIGTRITEKNPVKESLRASLSQLDVSKKQMLIHFRPDSPEIVDLDRQIAIITAQMKQEPDEEVRSSSEMLSTTYEQLRGRRTQLMTDLAGQKASLAVRLKDFETANTLLQTIPEKMRVVHDLDREHTAIEGKYSAIEQKLMMAAVSRATAQSAPSSIKVVAPATPPGSPVWPNTKLLLLLGTAIGLAAGVVLALVVDLLFGRVHRYRLADLGGNLQLYALVPHDGAYAAELFALPSAEQNPQARRLPPYRNG